MIKQILIGVSVFLFSVFSGLGCSDIEAPDSGNNGIVGSAELVADDSCDGCSGQIDSEALGDVGEALDESGAENSQIALNLRITVPKSENPHSEGDCDLWATLIRPSGDKKLPTILIAAPYRREMCIMMGIGLVAKGYNIMAVDIRGTGSSEGEWSSFDLVEQYDIRYVVDRFIPSMSCSDGTVGMFGMSYLAIIQYLTAGLVDQDSTGEPVHLKAIFPVVPMSDAYRDIVMHGGNLDMLFIPIWLGMVDMLGILPSLLNLGIDGKLTSDMINEAGATWVEHWNYINDTIYWIMDIDHLNDGNFYDSKSPMAYWPQKPAGGWDFSEGNDHTISSKLPVFTMGGWFDIFTRGTLNNYQYGLKNHSTSDKRMIIGEYYHMSGAAAMGINSLLTGDLPARWFDWKIKGKDDPFLDDFPVTLYVMGENKWRAEKSWPLPASRVANKTMYLTKKAPTPIDGDWYTEDEDGDYEDNNFGLSAARNVSGENPVLKHRPMLLDTAFNLNGAVSRSSARWSAGSLSSTSDMSKYFLGYNIDGAQFYEDERSDEKNCLTFTSEELTEDLEITGPVSLKFWARTEFGTAIQQASIDLAIELIKASFGVESNLMLDAMKKKDVQWVAELNDVFPGGRARNVSSGWLSAWHRQYDPSGYVREYDDEELGENIEHPLDPSYTPFDPFYDRPDKNPQAVNEEELYQYCIELWPTCNVFKKGHRIRVSLSASDFPHLLPIIQPSTNTIVIDADHEARIDFASVNTKNEGSTWKWIGKTGDMDDYLMSGAALGCGTSAQASIKGASRRNLAGELMGLIICMLFPFGLIKITRRSIKKIRGI
ncbi:MAG TPA: CocE/NonD family hydrolase [Spirochaetota bacterium]|nr:CocE/NonD family hydrolase [Spirochaetota bacterium]